MSPQGPRRGRDSRRKLCLTPPWGFKTREGVMEGVMGKREKKKKKVRVRVTVWLIYRYI